MWAKPRAAWSAGEWGTTTAVDWAADWVQRRVAPWDKQRAGVWAAH